MHNVPHWVEHLRGITLTVVWAVLLIRLPAVRHKKQRPLWLVLALMALGTISIQKPVADWIDAATGIEKASELAVALVALTDFACVWWLAVSLRQAERPTPAWVRRAPWCCAAVMAVLAVTFFALAPAAQRFGNQAEGWWVPYAITWTTYGAITAAGAGIIFWRQGVLVRSPLLRASLLAIALGTSAELPYQVIRAIRYFAPDPDAVLSLFTFWFSTSRFILVALGCSLAAVEPLLMGALYWYRRQRLFPLWVLMRQATPELMVSPGKSRRQDVLSIRNSWEKLHQRVVDIRDSGTYLYNSWATPEVLEQALRYSTRDGRDDRGRVVASACWLEYTRRRALARAPKLHNELDGSLLLAVQAEESITLREVRYLYRLHRALRSRPVRDFADRMQSAPEAPDTVA